ncbi:MAG: hypothetical protein GYA55_14250 [SAR324 cluster bacterium]|uniref:Uncharacterized protein n=1 Tax=SAR324 cluster bacterium TaxID=2024889 RepID=A0A7X9FU07_9DELT|nr:hypothetical protein [SAR324 cluster bacterium]
MGALRGSSDDDFKGMGLPPDTLDESKARPKLHKSRKKLSSSSFASKEIAYKNRHGTWLSPISQPETSHGFIRVASLVPKDQRYRHFIGSLAKDLDQVVLENKQHFKEPLEERMGAHDFNPCERAASRKLRAAILERSVENSPIEIPVSIQEEEVIVSLVKNEHEQPIAGALLYTWTEKGWISQGRMKYDNIFLIQLRHHSKLEPFHDNDRPVYCLNLRSFGPDSVDLRIMAIVKSEMKFLEAAVQPYKRKGDAFEGLPVLDHKGRVLIDERIVRRAGYLYSQYQRDLGEGRLYEYTDDLSDQIRLAHFIVLRAHFPELCYNRTRKTFQIDFISKGRGKD